MCKITQLYVIQHDFHYFCNYAFWGCILSRIEISHCAVNKTFDTVKLRNVWHLGEKYLTVIAAK